MVDDGQSQVLELVTLLSGMIFPSVMFVNSYLDFYILISNSTTEGLFLANLVMDKAQFKIERFRKEDKV